jgi:hypothetical protein
MRLQQAASVLHGRSTNDTRKTQGRGANTRKERTSLLAAYGDVKENLDRNFWAFTLFLSFSNGQHRNKECQTQNAHSASHAASLLVKDFFFATSPSFFFRPSRTIAFWIH